MFFKKRHFAKSTTLKFAILNVKISNNVEPIVKAAETKSAKILHFDSKLYIKTPKSDEKIEINIIIRIVFKKSKFIKSRFFSMPKFKTDEVRDIKI